MNPSTEHTASPALRGISLWAVLALMIFVAAGIGLGVWMAPWVRASTQRQLDTAIEQVKLAENQKLIDAETGDKVVEAIKALRPQPKADYYTCGMHPWVVLPKPGDCPICQMDLVPIDPAKFTGKITIDPMIVQNIGVRIEPVILGPLVKTIRTVGTIDYNEPTVRDVNIKVNGWIEKLHVDYLGAEVKAGDPLFSLYSPELYAAQEEYLLAWRNRDKVGAPFVPDAAKNAESLVKSARTKLEYFDITDQQIQQLQQTGQPAKTMTLRSPYSGIVIDKHANEGMKIDPGMRVFRIADLSKVWVMVTLYEYQLPYVQVGQEAVMSLPYVPGELFIGRVIYVYPYIDNKTRQVNVRLEFDNPTGLLKPGMFANVELRNELAAERTLVPGSAVLDTGTRQVAFVSLGEGRFEPRDVKLGVETEDGRVEVLGGLRPGEMVVTSGQFLLDSEAKMRESLAKMIKGNMASEQTAVAHVQGASELSTLPDALAGHLNALLHAYLKISESLFNDHLEGVDVSAKAIAQAADAMTQVTIPDHPHFWHQHEEVATVGGKATDLAASKDLKAARSTFADLSLALGDLLKATGVPPSFDKPIQQLHCPMYRTGQGGNLWLQTGEKVHNPFFGVNSTMPGCFDRRTVLPVTGANPDAVDAAPEKAPVEQTPANQSHVNDLFNAYLAVQTSLADDSTEHVPHQLAALRQAAMALRGTSDPALAEAARAVIKAADFPADDIKVARKRFVTLSDAAIKLAAIALPDASAANSLNEAFCPMAKAAWLQIGDTIANPYYGKSMLRCGDIRRKLSPAEAKE